MLRRKGDKHTLGLNEDAHLEINQKNERTRGFGHTSLISINIEIIATQLRKIVSITRRVDGFF